MALFIADHTGLVQSSGGLVRPVHIGAAHLPPVFRGPEPDCNVPGHASLEVAYSDLRLHHYLSRLKQPPSEIVAIMQRRRLYFFGQRHFVDFAGRFFEKKTAQHTSDSKWTPAWYRDTYVRRLAMVSQSELETFLGDADAVMSGLNTSPKSIHDTFLKGTTEIYQDDPRVVEAWTALRKVLNDRVGEDIVKEALDGSYGYYHNMMVTRWDWFLAYTEFLFSVLGELEAYRDMPRLFGYLAERIQTVYVHHLKAKDPTLKIKHRRVLKFV